MRWAFAVLMLMAFVVEVLDPSSAFVRSDVAYSGQRSFHPHRVMGRVKSTAPSAQSALAAPDLSAFGCGRSIHIDRHVVFSHSATAQFNSTPLCAPLRASSFLIAPVQVPARQGARSLFRPPSA
jgi:hypothetical protein